MVVESKKGLVHLEKNWGKRFPLAWLWVQGVAETSSSSSPSSSSSSSSISSSSPLAFVLSYGQVKDNLYTHFAHFRDEEKGLAWDFRPDNSYLEEEEVDGCAGTARFVLRGRESGRKKEEEESPSVVSIHAQQEQQKEEEEEGEGPSTHPPTLFLRKLVLELRRPPHTAACLLGPTGEGFERLCEESFFAEGWVEVWVGGEVVREWKMERVAFELGGSLMCGGKCEGSGWVGEGEGGVSAVV